VIVSFGFFLRLKFKWFAELHGAADRRRIAGEPFRELYPIVAAVSM
jgi:hypothetical protein